MYCPGCHGAIEIPPVSPEVQVCTICQDCHEMLIVANGVLVKFNQEQFKDDPTWPVMRIVRNKVRQAVAHVKMAATAHNN